MLSGTLKTSDQEIPFSVVNDKNEEIHFLSEDEAIAAIENGADPNDNAVKLAIQSQGSMDFDELLPHDSERIIKKVQAMMNMHNNFY